MYPNKGTEKKRNAFTRKQHPGFGKEIRELLKSPRREDCEVAGIVVDELKALIRHREEGNLHPKEHCLHGKDLSEIRYLRLYVNGHSTRPYFMVTGSTVWMLALDPNKRQTQVSKEMKRLLILRLRDLKADQEGRQ